MIIHKRSPRYMFFVGVLFLPTAGVLLFVVAYPMLRAFVMSLFDSSFLRPDDTRFIGLGNYTALLQDKMFWGAFKSTMIFNTATVAGGFLLGVFLAFLLNRSLRLRNFFRGLFLTPWVVPYVVIGFLFLYMFNVRMGVINHSLQRLGLVDEQVNFFTHGGRAMLTVIIASIWNQYPFHLTTTLAGLQTIPSELIEAARIDGASPGNIFWRIKLPWLRNVFIISTTLMMIQNFNNFAIIWSMTEGGPVNATNIFSVYVFKKAFVEWDFGYASAVGVVWLLLLMLFAWGYMRILEREVY